MAPISRSPRWPPSASGTSSCASNFAPRRRSRTWRRSASMWRSGSGRSAIRHTVPRASAASACWPWPVRPIWRGRRGPVRPRSWNRWTGWCTPVSRARWWSEVAAPSRQHSVTLGGRHQADNADAVRSFALADCGAALLPDWLVQHELERGELLEILPGYALPEQGIYAVFPNTHHVPAKVRQFIDFLRVSVTPPGVLPH